MKAKRISIVILTLVLALALTACESGDYKAAVAMAESGDWAGAREAFAALGDYEDSAAKVTECDYQIARGRMAAGEYEDAAELLKTLGDYEDAEALTAECDYQLAGEMLKAGDFDDAIAAYEALGSYEDAAEKAEECRYQKALGLLEQADYEGAEALFTELGDYADAAEKIDACRYQHAVSLYDAGSYQEALELFMTVPTYEQADHYCVLCSLLLDQNGFVDLFVASMNTALAADGFDLVFEEESVPYERDERSFYADLVPNRHEILLCFNCDDASGSGHADGQINNITVIGDTYLLDEFEPIMEEFLYTSILATCVLDDASLADPETTSQLICDSVSRAASGFNGTEDYNNSDSFEYHGYDCKSFVLFWPGADGIYRFGFSITIPELVEK